MDIPLLDNIKKKLKARIGAKFVDFSEISKIIQKPKNKKPQKTTPEIKPEKSLIPEGYKLSEIAQAAYEALECGAPIVFLTGRAGTGKTTFIHYVRKNIHKNIVTIAPTGIAALNVVGQTIHSFFKFPPRAFNNSDIKDLRVTTLFQNLDLLIIDEISMVRSDLMDHIDFALKKYRNKRTPFGGIQLLVVGDCLQLPPIVDSDAEHEMFNSKYRSPWFFDARVFSELTVYAVELSEVYRQKDLRFVELLSRIRLNDNHREAVGEINRTCYRDNKHDADLVLTATNAQAESINIRNLASINSEKQTYDAKIEGDFRVEGKRLPALENLELKVGAQVMVVKNIGSAVNGTIGIVKDLLDSSVVIEIKESKRDVTCTEEVWDQVKYKWDRTEKKIITKVVGRYKQIPLVLGWAITIHKSQGLTLESVKIDLGRGAFSPGQTYVALSRCRSIEKLHLAKPIAMKDVIADPRILEFYASLI